MNSKEVTLVKNALEQKKFNVVNEYAKIIHSDKGELVVNEYAGKDVRIYKGKDNTVNVLYPKNCSVVQEGHVAQAIANGTIFDDADEVDRNAMAIERTTLPYNAMINGGKNTPKDLKPMIAIVIGKIGDDGSFNPAAERINGENFIKDAVATKDEDNDNNINDVVNNYLDYDKEAPYTPDMGHMVHGLDKELDDIHDTDFEDTISDEDVVDSYDDFDIEALEKDAEDIKEEDEDGDNDNDNDDNDSDDDDSKDNESSDDDDAEVVEVDDDDDYVEEGAGIAVDTMRGENIRMSPDGSYHSGSSQPRKKKKALNLNSNSIVAKSEDLKNVMAGDFIRCVGKDGKVKLIRITVGKSLIDKNEKVKITVDGDSAKITVAPGNQSKIYKEESEPSSANVADDLSEANDNATVVTPTDTVEECGDNNCDIEQEGFLTKKPKKLKPIGRDVVAYITCEMNDIRSANDQAMLAGYTCSKIELVDFYLTVIDTQDARYIVPHNKAYLLTMKADLERLLAQILRIRPINRADQIWRVNYPTA